MFGSRTRGRLDKLEVDISKIVVGLDYIMQQLRSVRGLVNRKMKNKLEDDDEEGSGEEELDAATLQKNLMGFR